MIALPKRHTCERLAASRVSHTSRQRRFAGGTWSSLRPVVQKMHGTEFMARFSVELAWFSVDDIR